MFFLIIAIIILIIIGFIKQLYNINKFSNDYDNVKKYFEIFVEVTNKIIKNKDLDNNLYFELVKRSEEIQLLIGHYGIIDLEERGRMYTNYPLVLNAMPKLKDLIDSAHSWEHKDIIEELNMLQNGFLRYFNNLEIILNKNKKKIFNPFICMKEGIKQILSLPIKTLFWIGLINENSKNKIENGAFIKILTGVVELFTLLSTIMSIFIDWNTFIEIIKNILK